MNTEERAALAYDYIEAVANDNAPLQAISGAVGLGANWIADLATLPVYYNLWGRIQRLNGQGTITWEDMKTWVSENGRDLFEDLLMDKGYGSIPVLGIGINYTFAKAMAWRVGLWFSVMATLGDHESTSRSDEAFKRVKQAALVRLPTSILDIFFGQFHAPDKQAFIRLLMDIEALGEATLFPERAETGTETPASMPVSGDYAAYEFLPWEEGMTMPAGDEANAPAWLLTLSEDETEMSDEELVAQWRSIYREWCVFSGNIMPAESQQWVVKAEPLLLALNADGEIVEEPEEESEPGGEARLLPALNGNESQEESTVVAESEPPPAPASPPAKTKPPAAAKKKKSTPKKKIVAKPKGQQISVK